LCPSLPSGEVQEEPRVRIVNKKVVKPSLEEMERNPRSRSATLRSVELL
jgi:16S rRNA C1402 N4-methylase RsmH